MIVDYEKALDDSRFLMSHSPYHKDYDSNLYVAYIVNACKTNSIRLYYREGKPIGLVTWCYFEPEKAEEFLEFRYLPTEEDYIRRPNTQLWGIELIAPFGDGAYVFKAAKEEYTKLINEGEVVRWRRAKDPLRIHEKRFT